MPVVGGAGTSGIILVSAELYDPATGMWTATGRMATARDQHTVTLLPNGQVLVASGIRTGTAELYDPASGSWTGTDSLTPGRTDHTATLLRNGKVLVSGGNSMFGVLARAELYRSAPEVLDIR